jgi:glyoxylase-like metal-dependent hydrolase (beta-lactamase superfamily II)
MYNGRVQVGGPADVHELPRLIISKLAVGPHNNNAYLLRCRNTGVQLLIDAAAEPVRLLDLVAEGGLGMVVTTHGHSDHWQALAEVVAATGARTVALRPVRPSILPLDASFSPALFLKLIHGAISFEVTMQPAP